MNEDLKAIMLFEIFKAFAYRQSFTVAIFAKKALLEKVALRIECRLLNIF